MMLFILIVAVLLILSAGVFFWNRTKKQMYNNTIKRE